MQQQPDQPFLDVETSQPGRLGDGAADLLRGHRPEDDMPGLQGDGQSGIAESMVVEVGAQRQDHQAGPGQLAKLADELAPFGFVPALGEDGLELVHDDRRPPGVARVMEVRERSLERGERCAGRLQQAERAGQPGHQARPQQRRLARSRRSDQDQRQVRRLVRQAGQQVRDILTAEEPPRVLWLELGQAAIGSVRPAWPSAGGPPGPLYGTYPPLEQGGVGLTARPQDAE